MPPHVPVPRPGPCPKNRPGGIAEKAKKSVKKTTAVPKRAAPPAPPGVAALPRTPGRPESASTAAQKTNPMYGLTGGPRQPLYPEQGRAGQQWTPDLGPLPSHAFELNCTNVVLAWDMRMRGYDVQAAPTPVIDKHGYAAGRSFDDVDKLLAQAYRLPNGQPHGRSFFGKDRKGQFTQPWRSFADIDAEVERDWPEGGRGIITVAKHVFNVTKIGGKARYIEAQQDEVASRNVTRKYKSRYRSAGTFGSVQEGKLIRIDDLVPADGILQSAVTEEQIRQYAALQRQIPVPPKRQEAI